MAVSQKQICSDHHEALNDLHKHIQDHNRVIQNCLMDRDGTDHLDVLKSGRKLADKLRAIAQRVGPPETQESGNPLVKRFSHHSSQSNADQERANEFMGR